MAKTTKSAAAESDEVVVQVGKIELMAKDAETKAIALVDPFKEVLATMEKDYSGLEITDKTSLEFAQKGLRSMVSIRNQVEKKRLEIFKPFNELNKKVKGIVDEFTEGVKAIENPLKEKINAEEYRLQEEARKETIRRVKMLEDSGYTQLGQFYTCGPYRILFSSVESADEEQLAAWVKQGNEWIESERKRIDREREEREARDKELKEREARLAAQEAEMEEFRRWKASQQSAAPLAEAPLMPSGPTPPVHTDSPIQQAPPVQQPKKWPPHSEDVPPAPPADLFAGVVDESIETTHGNEQQQERVSSVADDMYEESKYIQTEDELAVYRRMSLSELRTQPEARVFWNMAIDSVMLRFTSETHTKAEWVEIFTNLKR